MGMGRERGDGLLEIRVRQHVREHVAEAGRDVERPSETDRAHVAHVEHACPSARARVIDIGLHEIDAPALRNRRAQRREETTVAAADVHQRGRGKG